MNEGDADELAMPKYTQQKKSFTAKERERDREREEIMKNIGGRDAFGIKRQF